MQLTGAAQTAQFWAVCQRSLFPVMEEEPGPLGEKHKLLASAFAMLELADGQAPRGRRGRPARDRLAIRRPLLAKMCFNLETTRGLLDGLRCDQTLRRLCGWPSQQAIPSESVCSRTFARLAESGCLEKVQERWWARSTKVGWWGT